MKSIWKSKIIRGLSVPLAVIIASVGLLSDVGGVWDLLKNFIPNKEPLVAIQGRFSPIFRNPGFSSNHDDVSLSFQVRNYSEAPVTLIAASLSVENARTVAVAKSGGKGGCTLGPARNENSPITIAPGATQWLTVGENIELRGVSSYLTDKRLSNVFVHETAGSPFGIAQLTYVDDLNAYFDKAYGSQARIKVTVQSISNKEHIFTFPIAQGKNLFATDGSLHHDWLIANWKNWKNIRSLGGYKCELKYDS
ncbi:hypothetical protein K5Q02_14025 [Pseudomonas sp. MM211]|uniref:hypothetical protein n=1 Tax=Pseudomonas sp. MM211 TaxID=2866808 RepID=UPI001CED77ED|nr:hypothetical protein [Pseudomonas sp. MM211]UCJ14990.1 hypothetical protein K5Q02_14025 [Pseudomonas sp. MM211]